MRSAEARLTEDNRAKFEHLQRALAERQDYFDGLDPSLEVREHNVLMRAKDEEIERELNTAGVSHAHRRAWAGVSMTSTGPLSLDDEHTITRLQDRLAFANSGDLRDCSTIDEATLILFEAEVVSQLTDRRLIRDHAFATSIERFQSAPIIRNFDLRVSTTLFEVDVGGALTDASVLFVSDLQNAVYRPSRSLIGTWAGLVGLAEVGAIARGLDDLEDGRVDPMGAFALLPPGERVKLHKQMAELLLRESGSVAGMLDAFDSIVIQNGFIDQDNVAQRDKIFSAYTSTAIKAARNAREAGGEGNVPLSDVGAFIGQIRGLAEDLGGEVPTAVELDALGLLAEHFGLDHTEGLTRVLQQNGDIARQLTKVLKYLSDEEERKAIQLAAEREGAAYQGLIDAGNLVCALGKHLDNKKLIQVGTLGSHGVKLFQLFGKVNSIDKIRRLGFAALSPLAGIGSIVLSLASVFGISGASHSNHVSQQLMFISQQLQEIREILIENSVGIAASFTSLFILLESRFDSLCYELLAMRRSIARIDGRMSYLNRLVQIGFFETRRTEILAITEGYRANLLGPNRMTNPTDTYLSTVVEEVRRKAILGSKAGIVTGAWIMDTLRGANPESNLLLTEALENSLSARPESIFQMLAFYYQLPGKLDLRHDTTFLDQFVNPQFWAAAVDVYVGIRNNYYPQLRDGGYDPGSVFLLDEIEFAEKQIAVLKALRADQALFSDIVNKILAINLELRRIFVSEMLRENSYFSNSLQLRMLDDVSETREEYTPIVIGVFDPLSEFLGKISGAPRDYAFEHARLERHGRKTWGSEEDEKGRPSFLLRCLLQHRHKIVPPIFILAERLGLGKVHFRFHYSVSAGGRRWIRSEGSKHGFEIWFDSNINGQHNVISIAKPSTACHVSGLTYCPDSVTAYLPPSEYGFIPPGVLNDDYKGYFRADCRNPEEGVSGIPKRRHCLFLPETTKYHEGKDSEQQMLAIVERRLVQNFRLAVKNKVYAKLLPLVADLRLYRALLASFLALVGYDNNCIEKVLAYRENLITTIEAYSEQEISVVNYHQFDISSVFSSDEHELSKQGLCSFDAISQLNLQNPSPIEHMLQQGRWVLEVGYKKLPLLLANSTQEETCAESDRGGCTVPNILTNLFRLFVVFGHPLMSKPWPAIPETASIIARSPEYINANENLDGSFVIFSAEPSQPAYSWLALPESAPSKALELVEYIPTTYIGWWDKEPEIDFLSRHPIYTFRVYENQGIEAGKLSFYGVQYLCRTRADAAHNLISRTGIFENVPFNVSQIENICPFNNSPNFISDLIEVAGNSTIHGAVRGAANIFSQSPNVQAIFRIDRRRASELNRGLYYMLYSIWKLLEIVARLYFSKEPLILNTLVSIVLLIFTSESISFLQNQLRRLSVELQPRYRFLSQPIKVLASAAPMALFIAQLKVLSPIFLFIALLHGTITQKGVEYIGQKFVLSPRQRFY